MSSKAARKRKSEVANRVSKPDHMYSYCRVIGCGKPATAGTSTGLNQRFCRKHEDHYERHGSPYKRSYPAKQLTPHRKAALLWIRAHEDDVAVRMSINAVVSLYQAAGPRIEAFRLAGLAPDERARATWASLREGNVDAREVLAVWLGVEAAICGDKQAELKREYKLVQAGKLLHRMAGGAHKRWERLDTRGGVMVTEMHKYPHSRGRVLRHLGEQLERSAEIAVNVFMGTR